LMASSPIRVLIADEDGATRTGVRLALVEGGFEICGEAGTAADAIDAARRERPDFCLIEADLPGGGIAAAEAIVDSISGTAVVMLCGRVSDDRLFAALRAGARGYLVKDMDPARLAAALHGVLRGEAAIPRALMGRVVDELRASARGRHAGELSKRRLLPMRCRSRR
jgi:DNA-binding NarL/FixJ family response regulator